MATICPAGIPQAVCDLVTAKLQTRAQGDGPVPIVLPYDANDILSTFLQWYPDAAVARGGSLPIPSDPVAYNPGSLAGDILNAADKYWQTIGSQNPTAARTVDISNFPWQYLGTNSTNPAVIVQSTLDTIMMDPVARQWLSTGKLPPFDPGWIDSTNTGIWANPVIWPAAVTAVNAFIPNVNVFVQRAAACGLFTKSVDVVNQAWVNYITFGGNPADPRGDPCSVVTTAPPVVNPPPPPPPPPPTPDVQIITAPATPTPTWIPVALAAVGAGVLGLIVYVATKSKGSPFSGAFDGPAMEMENPVRRRRKRRRRNRK